MHELHLLHLEARRVHEVTPLTAAETTLRARELARLHLRVRAGPRLQRVRPALMVVRTGRTPAEQAGV
jgi:hypothetical protein